MSFKVKKPRIIQKKAQMERLRRKQEQKKQKQKEKSKNEDGFENADVTFVSNESTGNNNNYNEIPDLDEPLEIHSINDKNQKVKTTCTKAQIDISTGTLTIDEDSCTTEILDNQIKIDESNTNKDSDNSETDKFDNDSEFNEL